MHTYSHRSKSEFTLRALIVLVLGLTLSVSGISPAQASLTVAGPIDTDTTWILAESPYLVTADVQVQDGVTLTIEPGVEVQFQANTGLVIAGTLIARGNSGAAVRFTSALVSPAAGDWKGLHFTNSAVGTTLDVSGDYVSGSILQYCVFEYAGSGGAYAVSAESLMIDNCTVRDSAAGGLDDPGTAIARSRISGNKLQRLGSVNGDGGAIYTAYANVIVNKIEAAKASGKGGGIYANESDIVDNAIVDCQAASFGGGIYARYSLVSENLLQQNKASKGGGIYSVGSIVQDNILIGNQATSGGGIQAAESEINQNVISNNTASSLGGGLYAIFSPVLGNTVAHNVASAPSGRGAGAFVDGNWPFEDNSLVGNFAPLGSNGGGMEIIGTPTRRGNNLYGNFPYDVKVSTANDIDGVQNYWGTSNATEIAEQIYDKDDDGNLGNFNYSPYLSQLSADAPLPPPLGLNLVFQDGTGTLAWQALPGTSSITYKVYYDTDGPYPPYEGQGLTQGDSPIDAGGATQILLDGFKLGQGYYFAVTATDSGDQDSWYSNVIQGDYGERTFLPMIINVTN